MFEFTYLVAGRMQADSIAVQTSIISEEVVSVLYLCSEGSGSMAWRGCRVIVRVTYAFSKLEWIVVSIKISG